MNITSAEFISSHAKMEKLPQPNLPEFAFIGRSNVGKSSLINMLTKKKGLAKISGTPGKTQTINHFLINNSWYIVDLPGYGFAKVSHTTREAWGKMISRYLQQRLSLMNVFVLVDIRLEPQKNDLDFINRLGELSIPFAIVFTKADKLIKSNIKQHVAAYNKTLSGFWEELPREFVTSADSSWGRDELLSYIEEIIKQYKPII